MVKYDWFIDYFRYVKDATMLQNLAQNMEELIFNFADVTFFFNELEDCDQVIFSLQQDSLTDSTTPAVRYLISFKLFFKGSYR